MQKLILSIVVAAFAVTAQAGDKQGACCPSKAKSEAAKGQCPASKEAKQAKETKQALLSPKSQK